MNNLSLLTYTHSKASDLHKPYYERLLKYFPDMKNIFFTCNEKVEYGKTFIYNDDDNHSVQMIRALEKIPTDFVMYSQEDYILYDYVKIKEIKKCIKVLENDPEVAFIRLIHSGLGNKTKKYNKDFTLVDPNSVYFFSTQASIWRKEHLIEMFKSSDVKSIFDEPYNSLFLKLMLVKGLYENKKGTKVGGHFNSWIYPYIATAIVKGKWNIKEYSKELDLLHKEYDIDPNIRGVS
tara:strand:+ start:9844 stop:10548 length:705 start_codon:yes stop_codon:yes gene_type:complete